MAQCGPHQLPTIRESGRFLLLTEKDLGHSSQFLNAGEIGSLGRVRHEIGFHFIKLLQPGLRKMKLDEHSGNHEVKILSGQVDRYQA
jgi:hypothetical protein